MKVKKLIIVLIIASSSDAKAGLITHVLAYQAGKSGKAECNQHIENICTEAFRKGYKLNNCEE